MAKEKTPKSEPTPVEMAEENYDKARKLLETAVARQTREMIGKVFHPTGLDFFSLVVEVDRRKVKTIDITMGDIIHATHDYTDNIFNPEYLSSPKVFLERVDAVRKEIQEKLC